MLAPREVTTSSVHLAWERSDDRKFREYKVYASHSPAFDETNGLLVHVGTKVSLTDFQLTGRYVGGSPLVSADTGLYFRVFVLGEDGTLTDSAPVLPMRNCRLIGRRFRLAHVEASGSASSLDADASRSDA
ncbi:hypothetical protein OV208_36480 [Corallococcus sp. bb12-1]|uniref:hypothetical protein n=1 Tax=Corallococcus sp. bb12-1 TaxID=2996784 RepID=UPI002271CD71|nr:hypothetical protein [Corallococcus sp. bb12-1]MCY1046859.1 hypothetical protein [Corallococcus sp. bb12-1]